MQPTGGAGAGGGPRGAYKGPDQLSLDEYTDGKCRSLDAS